MIKPALQEWHKLTIQNKQNIFLEIAKKMNLPPAAIEKDWWVVQTLDLIFTTDISPYTVFKGGTSLSKAWNLVDRFSEDIDLALDRTYLGFTKPMTNSQVKKLREHSFKFITGTYFPSLQKTFADAGLEVKMQLSDIKSNDEDPVKIEVNYESVTDKSAYLPTRVLIEIGSHSLKESFTEKYFSSFAGEHFKGRNFADLPIVIPTVNPERIFLEKIFLLHEEFQQAQQKVKIERRSGHFYDLEKLMDTEFAAKAIADKHLYHHIVEHRRTVTPLRGIDYSNHAPEKINLIPPAEIISEWRKDYEQMRESMIYTDSLPFEKLMKRISELQERINKISGIILYGRIQ